MVGLGEDRCGTADEVKDFITTEFGEDLIFQGLDLNGHAIDLYASHDPDGYVGWTMVITDPAQTGDTASCIIYAGDDGQFGHSLGSEFDKDPNTVASDFNFGWVPEGDFPELISHYKEAAFFEGHDPNAGTTIRVTLSEDLQFWAMYDTSDNPDSLHPYAEPVVSQTAEGDVVNVMPSNMGDGLPKSSL